MGMPDQATYDRAVALAQLVLDRIHPVIGDCRTTHLELSDPPPLSAGLATPLPAALTGDGRDVDTEEQISLALETMGVIEVAVDSEWALGSR